MDELMRKVVVRHYQPTRYRWSLNYLLLGPLVPVSWGRMANTSTLGEQGQQQAKRP